jgi:hypothetical protein
MQRHNSISSNSQPPKRKIPTAERLVQLQSVLSVVGTDSEHGKLLHQQYELLRRSHQNDQANRSLRKANRAKPNQSPPQPERRRPEPRQTPPQQPEPKRSEHKQQSEPERSESKKRDKRPKRKSDKRKKTIHIEEEEDTSFGSSGNDMVVDDCEEEQTPTITQAPKKNEYVELIGNDVQKGKMFIALKRVYQPDAMTERDVDNFNSAFNQSEKSDWLLLITGSPSIGKKTHIRQLVQHMDIELQTITINRVIDYMYKIRMPGDEEKRKKSNRHKQLSESFEYGLRSILSQGSITGKKVLYVLQDIEQWFDWNRFLVSSVLKKLATEKAPKGVLVMIVANKPADYNCYLLKEKMYSIEWWSLKPEQLMRIMIRKNPTLSMGVLNKLIKTSNGNLKSMDLILQWFKSKTNVELTEQHLSENQELIQSMCYDSIHDEGFMFVAKKCMNENIQLNNQNKLKLIGPHAYQHSCVIHQNTHQRASGVGEMDSQIRHGTDISERLSRLQLTQHAWVYDSRVGSLKEMQAQQLVFLYQQLSNEHPNVDYPQWMNENRKHNRATNDPQLTELNKLKDKYIF